MGVFVVHHLDAMLQGAQPAIGVGQFVGRLGRDVAGFGKGGQGLQGARRSQGRVPPAQDQLLGLDVELDLADAAAAELQVRALGGEPIVDLVDMDLPLDRVDVGDGGEVEIAPPDEGLQLRQEALAPGGCRRPRRAP